MFFSVFMTFQGFKILKYFLSFKFNVTSHYIKDNDMFNYEMYLSGIPDLFLYVFILYGLALESSMREWRIYTIMPDIINIQTI